MKILIKRKQSLNSQNKNLAEKLYYVSFLLPRGSFMIAMRFTMLK